MMCVVLRVHRFSCNLFPSNTHSIHEINIQFTHLLRQSHLLLNTLRVEENVQHIDVGVDRYIIVCMYVYFVLPNLNM